jgi:hypothetical protein
MCLRVSSIVSRHHFSARTTHHNLTSHLSLDNAQHPGRKPPSNTPHCSLPSPLVPTDIVNESVGRCCVARNDVDQHHCNAEPQLSMRPFPVPLSQQLTSSHLHPPSLALEPRPHHVQTTCTGDAAPCWLARAHNHHHLSCFDPCNLLRCLPCAHGAQLAGWFTCKALRQRHRIVAVDDVNKLKFASVIASLSNTRTL